VDQRVDDATDLAESLSCCHEAPDLTVEEKEKVPSLTPDPVLRRRNHRRARSNAQPVSHTLVPGRWELLAEATQPAMQGALRRAPDPRRHLACSPRFPEAGARSGIGSWRVKSVDRPEQAGMRAMTLRMKRKALPWATALVRCA
jgi:hypothetical protein